MDLETVTKFLIILAFFIVFVWDCIVMFFGKSLDATISLSLYKISKDNPIIPFALGVLCGHVFWPLGGAEGFIK